MASVLMEPERPIEIQAGTEELGESEMQADRILLALPSFFQLAVKEGSTTKGAKVFSFDPRPHMMMNSDHQTRFTANRRSLVTRTLHLSTGSAIIFATH